MAKRFRIVLPLAAPLMILAIVGIASFQAYWMRKLYSQEWAELRKETDLAFRDVVYKLQMQHFSKDTFFTKHNLPPNLFLFNMLDSMRTRLVDSFDPGPASGGKRSLTVSIQTFDDRDSSGARVQDRLFSTDSGAPHVMRYFNSRKDSEPPLSVAQIDSAYKIELLKSHITIPFRIERIQGPPAQLDQPPPPDKLQTNFLYLGLSKAYAYQASFDSPVRYILGRMGWPIALGVLLLGFTAMAFVVLYRNLQQQQRLAQYKNDFISNMTHELKTPISTIKVAVEALRHFDALDDPKRSREYLDISALELQRLSMLVDKVLKLSQFENKEIEFQLTVFDLRELAAEVMAGMRLPFEKAGAVVQLTAGSSIAKSSAGDAEGGVAGRAASGMEGRAASGMEGGAAGRAASGMEGRFNVRGDRAHLSSVISNLLDNALKYSKEAPVITVQVGREERWVLLSVTDNGIGIPPAYQDRIFDKFFRIPSGDHHNIKGYGLGLNYVRNIIHVHRGSIRLDSKEGKGSTFTIKLPAA
jgi:two-component system phosphate regulon sensor histidine kinase PhoR